MLIAHLPVSLSFGYFVVLLSPRSLNPNHRSGKPLGMGCNKRLQPCPWELCNPCPIGIHPALLGHWDQAQPESPELQECFCAPNITSFPCLHPLWLHWGQETIHQWWLRCDVGLEMDGLE